MDELDADLYRLAAHTEEVWANADSHDVIRQAMAIPDGDLLTSDGRRLKPTKWTASVEVSSIVTVTIEAIVEIPVEASGGDDWKGSDAVAELPK